MRRLAQIALLLLFAATLLTPIAEYLDRWDPAGLSNDTEFAVFAFIFTLTFVLVLCQLLARLALRFASLLLALFDPSCVRLNVGFASARTGLIEPPLHIPLRI